MATRERSLSETHRPRMLADMVGQGQAVMALSDFAACPRSRAFIFAGPTGCGKTTAARCLANELGCHPTSGVWEFDGPCVDEDTMDALASEMRFAPMGDGWRVVIINEADYLTRCPKTYLRFNGMLESNPTRTVFVFTTNEPDKFSERFMDRCERIDFAGDDGATLGQDAQLMIDRVWLAETGRADSPRLADMPGIVNAKGQISFRRAVEYLDPIIRQCEPFALKAKPQAAPSLWQAAIDRERYAEPVVAAAVEPTLAEIERHAVPEPAPESWLPCPIPTHTPRPGFREAVPTRDVRDLAADRRNALAAFLDAPTTSKPTINSMVARFGASYHYTRKQVLTRFPDAPAARPVPEAEMPAWFVLPRYQVA